MLLQQFPDIQYVLLDDAFQHRTVKPSLSIVLVDYTRPLSKDCLLPAGNLRESKRFIRRADIIIVTKCPNQLSQVVQEKIQHDLKILPTQKIFFSGINYSDKLLPVYSGAISGTTLDIHPGCKVLLVTGIANPAPLIEFIQQFAIIEKVMSFPDHYYFSHEDMRSLSLAFQRIKAEDKIILTTEKDASRFRLINPPVEFSRSLFYIPISVKLLDNKESDFYELLLNAGKQNIYI